MEPPENRLDGSIAMMPTMLSRARSSRTSEVNSVLFPAPGGPVMPTIRASPPSLLSSATCSTTPSAPDSMREIIRAIDGTCPREPARSGFAPNPRL